MKLRETWPANPLRRAWTDRSALRETAGAASGFAGAGCTGAEAWVAATPTREASYGVRRRHPALTPGLSACCDGWREHHDDVQDSSYEGAGRGLRHGDSAAPRDWPAVRRVHLAGHGYHTRGPNRNCA